MNIRCPHCRTVFRVNPERIPPSGVRAKCARCGDTFLVTPPPPSAGVAAVAGPPVPARPQPTRSPASETPPPAAARPGAPAGSSGLAAPPPTEGAMRAAAASPAPLDRRGEGAAASTPTGRAPTGQAPAVRAAAPAGATPPGASATPAGSAAPAAAVPPVGTAPAAGAARAVNSGTRTDAGRPAVAAPRGGFATKDPRARAERLARALVSDIVAYHPERREKSLSSGSLRTEFREEIMKSWEEYVAQVGMDVAKSTPYFRDALNSILAKGQRIF